MSRQGFERFSLADPLHPGITLLEASAGTGKTYSIAALALRLVVEQGLTIDKLLIVTFTKAATAELRVRVRARFAEAVRALEQGADAKTRAELDPVLARLCDDEAKRDIYHRRALAALAAFDTAVISTIHGFCQRILQSGAFETGAPLDAELQESDRELLEEIVDDFLHLELVDVSVPRFVAAQGLAGLDRKRALQVASKITASPDARVEGAALPAPKGAAELDPTTAIDELAQLWAEEREALVQYMSSGAFKKGSYKPEQIEAYTAALDGWLAPPDEAPPITDALQKAAARLGRHGLDAGKNKAGREAPEPQRFAFPDALDGFAQTFGPALWGRFVAFVRGERARRLEAAKAWMFDDLLHELDAALADPRRRPAVQALAQQAFHAALIDEFQDTDRFQWRIFKQLFETSEHYLFLIGDPKQSIYRFRGADVATYLRARQSAERRFALTTNWRSDGALIEVLNRLYAPAPALSEGIEYQAVDVPQAHQGSRITGPNGDPLPAFRLVHFPLCKARGQTRRAANQLKAEIPARVAADVASLLEGDARVEGRALTPRDIAVLVNTNAQGQAVESELRARGVPAVRHSQGSVFDTPEAQWVGLMLDAWLNPRRPSLTRALMLTPLGGRTRDDAEDLVARDDERSVDAWIERELGHSVQHGQTWRDAGIAKAWREFAERVDLTARMAATDEGLRAWTNYQHLIELLHAEQTHARLGPLGLWRWFAQQRGDARSDEAEQIRLDRDDAALTIVTVHSSKGLEYPVVFYPYASAAAGNTDFSSGQAFAVPDDRGDWVVDLPQPGPQRAALRKQRIAAGKAQEAEEAARKLYVALTRAKHQLHVYWGAAEQKATLEAPMTALLCDPMALGQAAKSSDDPLDTVRRFAVDAFAERVGDLGQVEIAEVHAIDIDKRWNPAPTPGPRLEARSFSRRSIDRLWRRASYSSLVHGASYTIVEGSPAAEGMDMHPRELPPRLDDAVEEASSATAVIPEPREHRALTLASFPRGADAGTFIHAALEHLDFTRVGDTEHIDEVLEEQMRTYSIATSHHEALAQGLAQMLRTPLGGPLGACSLSQVGRRDRIDEMSFELPIVGGLESADAQLMLRGEDFAAAVRSTRLPSPAMPLRALDRWTQLEFSAPARGFLTGAIDLVFRAPCQDGQLRYFVADYKSNWLGDVDRTHSHVGHYTPARLVEAMIDHDYYLQYHLYVLAVHRYLRARLGDNYDYARDFGGVYYLFVRGMVGADAPRDEAGQSCGVFYDRPEPACVDAMDRAFVGAGSLLAPRGGQP